MIGTLDFRACLNALSDVVINRPPPLRHFDQIYVKLPDMLLQAEHIRGWFHDKMCCSLAMEMRLPCLSSTYSPEESERPAVLTVNPRA
jgi:hypothetical protein